jgi:hypothetical protein
MWTFIEVAKPMIERNQYLLELAKRTAEVYITNPKTKAAMVTGSVAEGLCDEYSDCEMFFYYDELPSEAELYLARQQNQGSEPLWTLGNLQEGLFFGESYLVNGVEFQIGHQTMHNGRRIVQLFWRSLLSLRNQSAVRNPDRNSVVRQT